MKHTINERDIHQKHKDEIFQVLKNEPYAQFLGIDLLEIDEGSASAEVKVQDHMLNAHGTVHGGVIFAIADYVFAAACNSYGKTSVGLSTTIHFMAAGYVGSTLQAEALEEKKNHRTSWYKINIRSDNELIATMEALAYRKNDYFISLEE